jgi:putative transposase
MPAWAAHCATPGTAPTRSWQRSSCGALVASLQANHPGAAASLSEGLEEPVTVQSLGVTGALYRMLRTTNPIENLNGSIAHYTRNVKRWRDGKMTLRWVASALSDAKDRFRKLRGHSDMKRLIAAMDARIASQQPTELKAA